MHSHTSLLSMQHMISGHIAQLCSVEVCYFSKKCNFFHLKLIVTNGCTNIPTNTEVNYL